MVSLQELSKVCDYLDDFVDASAVSVGLAQDVSKDQRERFAFRRFLMFTASCARS